MSEPKLISPMLDRFVMGGPISDHDGVRCCPAMEKDSDNRYIVKVISVPSSQKQLDALLLTGAYSTQDEALAYFKTLSDDVVEEVNTLDSLSKLEGFVAYEDMQVAPMDDGTGYDIYLLGAYKRTLARQFMKEPMTHLGAINLGLDMCAALAVCRRSGYLYVDLKPSNIFVTSDKEYRIGDLGFIRLDSLKYTSLPDKYRSQYTAPEIKDAFSSLNSTIDVYAIGLILYQAYNNGALPFTEGNAPEDGFTAPLYADYEMAEIILKACAPDPENRWQDPMEMGHALVSYMQRNGANDTPIVPPAPVVEEEAMPEDVEQTEEAAAEEASPAADEQTADESSNPDESVYTEDELGNISFLLEETDETVPGEEDSEVEYNEVSDEVSDILTQVDELASHPVPEPVVAPEPAEITIPETVVSEEDESEDTEATEDSEAPAGESEEESEQPVKENEEPESEEATETQPKQTKRTSGHWLRNTILVVLILAVIAAGAYFYINYYLQPIDSIQLDGTEDSLTVYVESKLDDTLLRVVCADPHGNQITSVVEDGKAVFTNLVPDTAYTVKVITESFHKLTGDVSKAYSTPIQSNIVQFTAVTGAENGSAILSFTVDGPDSDEWTIVYSTEGEEEKTITFPSHMVTVTGLTVGKTYTFRLVPQTELYVTGMEEITFTAAELVYAEKLRVTSCVNNALTAVWDTPAGASVDTWTVRCYNDDYNETIITAQNTAVFDGLDHTKGFTVEVTAAAMSVSQRTYVSENSVTLSNFNIDPSDHSQLLLRWDATQDIPEDGWHLTYTIDGSELQSTILCEENAATIPYQVPGTVYEITIQDAAGAIALGTPLTYTVPASDTFSCEYDGYAVTSESMEFYMCKTPAWQYWDRYDLDYDDYTTQFSAGRDASFLVYLSKEYGTSDDMITTIFAIRDSEGKLVSVSETVRSWNDMWYRNYCELDIPEMPAVAGEYKMQVYFNGALAHTQDFAITD